MQKLLLPCLLALVLPACQEEVIAVRGNSLASKLGQFNQGGWAVTGDQPTSQQRTNSANTNSRGPGGMNWSSMQFDTNFQVDDPQLRAQLEQQRQQRLQQQQAQQPAQQQNQQNPPSGQQPPPQPPSTQPAPSLFGPFAPGP